MAKSDISWLLMDLKLVIPFRMVLKLHQPMVAAYRSEIFRLDVDSQHRIAAWSCGRMCRSAGTSAVLMAREADWAQVTLPSGEIRRIPSSCRATIWCAG